MRFLASLLLLMLVACAAQSSPQAIELAPTAAQLWVREVERAHATADRATTTPQARAALVGVRTQSVPSSVRQADRQRVLKDVQFRLALLALRDAAPQDASEEADRGLQLDQTDDEFTANLWIVKGRAEAKLGHVQNASKAYAAALAIHDRLLDQALEGKP